MTGSAPSGDWPSCASGAPGMQSAQQGQENSLALIQALLDRAVEIACAQHGMALVVDSVREMVVCRAVCRLPTSFIGSLSFQIGQGNTGRVAMTGQPVRLNPTGGSRSGAVLIVPVQDAGRVVCVLNLNGAADAAGFSVGQQAAVVNVASECAPELSRVLAAEVDRGGDENSMAHLVDPALLDEIQAAFTQMTGSPCAFVDPLGRCVRGIVNPAGLCALMRANPASARRCELSMGQACAVAGETSQSFHECHAGVRTCVLPIWAGGQCLGALVVMLSFQARDASLNRARAGELGLDPYEVLSLASQFPSASESDEFLIQSAGRLVARMVGSIVQERLGALQQEELTRRIERDSLGLQDLTRQLTTVLELPHILSEVARRAVQLLGGVAADVCLVGPGGRLDVRSQRGLGQEILNLLGPAIGDSPAARCVSTGRLWIVEDIGSETLFPAWKHAVRRQEHARSAIALPLRSAEGPIGALTLYLGIPGKPEDSWQRLAAAVADRASLAIRSAQATEQARANEIALRTFLSRMTRGLSSSIDTGQLIQWVADFAAEMTRVSHCAVYELVDEELTVRAISRTGRTVIERPVLRIGEGLSGQAAASRRLVQVVDVRKDPRFVTGAADIPADAVSYAGIPLLYKSELLGVLAVYGDSSSFSEADLQLLGSFAGQAAIAIQNARSFEHQRAIASTMQQSFLPRDRLQMDGLEVGALYVPASEEVGGDYYDFLKVGERTAVVVLGDVSGKGIRAATFTAMGKYVLRAYAFEDSSPHTVLKRMNAVMAVQLDPGNFITLFYARVDLDAMRLHYASAGHPDGLLYRPSIDEFCPLPSTGMLIGAFPGESFDSKVVKIQVGDMLVLYTDGVLESRRGQEMFGAERLMKVIRDHGQEPANQLAQTIYDHTTRFRSDSMADDICILVLRFVPLSVDQGLAGAAGPGNDAVR